MSKPNEVSWLPCMHAAPQCGLQRAHILRQRKSSGSTESVVKISHCQLMAGRPKPSTTKASLHHVTLMMFAECDAPRQSVQLPVPSGKISKDATAPESHCNELAAHHMAEASVPIETRKMAGSSKTCMAARRAIPCKPTSAIACWRDALTAIRQTGFKSA